MDKKILFRHGGFRRMRSFRCAQAVYDSTVVFCDMHIRRFSRTHDQMVQAARSGVQNIAEGSLASATSKKTEIKLTNVARASLGELLLDYQDFLRHRGLAQWTKDEPRALEARRRLRAVGSDKSDKSDKSDPLGISGMVPEEAANTIICLIHQTSFLLGRQIEALERRFLEEGGFTERLFRSRRERRA